MKAHELIAILRTNPDAEILTPSDDGWKLNHINDATLLDKGTDISKSVDHYEESDNIDKDGLLRVAVFVLY